MNNIKLFLNKVKEYVLNNILVLIFVVLSLINTTLLRFMTVGNYFEIGPFLADIFGLLIIGVSSYLISDKHRYKYLLAWTFIIVIVSAINSVYYTNYVSYASISLLRTATQVVDVSNAVFENVMEIKDLSYIWQIPVFIILYKLLKNKKLIKEFSKTERRKNVKNIFINSLVVLILFIFTLSPTKITRFFNKWNREYIVMHFGCVVYQFNDIVQTLSSNLDEFFGYDKAYKEFREFYENREYTHTDNEFTNIFKDKNVIVIHAESIQGFTMDLSFNGKELTPNLNKLAKEGIYFSNFYAVESVGTSSDTEFTYNTSLLPSSIGTVFMSYYDRKYNSTPALLKENGYNTFSMHGNKCDFWNRNIMHKNLGYNNFYCYKDAYNIDETIGLGLSDKSFFKQSVPIIKQNSNSKFYSLLIMLSNHTPFSDIKGHNNYDLSYTYTDKSGSTVKDNYLDGTTMGNYLRSVNYADEAIGEFINDLDKEGLLDNTVIIIYGDHDAKLKKTEFERYYNYNNGRYLTVDDKNYVKVDDYDYELNRKVPFIIWTKDKKFNLKVDKVMSMLDVEPTLGNMFGFENKYALGHDIFSIDENVIVFPDGNWLTDKMYYNYQKDEGKLLNGNTSVSSKYIEYYNDYAYKLISISDDIIVYNLLKNE